MKNKLELEKEIEIKHEQINIYKRVKQKMQREKKQTKIKSILAASLIPIFMLLIKELYPILEMIIKLKNSAANTLIMSQTLLISSIALATAAVTYEVINYIRLSNELKDLDNYLEELSNDAEEKQQQIKQQEEKEGKIKNKTVEEKIKILNEAKELFVQNLKEEIEKTKKLTR